MCLGNARIKNPKNTNLVGCENNSQSKISKSKHTEKRSRKKLHVNKRDTTGDSYALTLISLGTRFSSLYSRHSQTPHFQLFRQQTSPSTTTTTTQQQGFSNIACQRLSLFRNCLCEPRLLHKGVSYTVLLSYTIETNSLNKLLQKQ